MKVKQKRTAADYLAEHGFAGLPDAEDPEEDEDTEVLSSDEGEPPVRQERAHGEGEPPVRRGRERHPPDWWIANNYALGYCYGNCGERHKCFGDGCNRRDQASFAEPCPWEMRERLCVDCTEAQANPAQYEGDDYDDYYDG